MDFRKLQTWKGILGIVVNYDTRSVTEKLHCRLRIRVHFLSFRHFLLFYSFSIRKSESSSLKRITTEAPQPTVATVMPDIKPRPNLHAQQHNLDTLERMVFEDFNGSPYASKSTIVMSGWDSICCQWSLLKRKLDYIDPRGYINISWLFIQVSHTWLIFL